MSELKTNAMRILDAMRVSYQLHTYEPGESVDGVSVATKMGMDVNKVYKTLVTQGKGGELTARQLDMDLAHALAHYLHLDQVTLILCGGQDQIAAQREQWNDGSNTLCIRPGVVIAYDRNYITNEILESYGITVLKIPSGELSRGRGGPRCMSMPLIRDVKF